MDDRTSESFFNSLDWQVKLLCGHIWIQRVASADTVGKFKINRVIVASMLIIQMFPISLLLNDQQCI